MLTFSLILITLTNLFTKNNKLFYLYMLALLFGFYLSWNFYNIFLLTGVTGVLLIHKTSRSIIYPYLKNFKFILLFIAFFILGYILGNFHLIDKPLETLKGIKAYAAHYNFKSFLFFNNRHPWDHINIMSYTATNFLLSVVIFVGLILPILLKQYLYILVSIFLSICLYIFITYFSTGYPWHGFPFSTFIIFLFLILLGYFKFLSPKYRAILLVICYFVVSLQIKHNFTIYIPLQTKWYYNTKNIADNIQKNTFLINKIINKEIIKNSIKNNDYLVFLNFERVTLNNSKLNYIFNTKNLVHMKSRISKNQHYIFSIYDTREEQIAPLAKLHKSYERKLLKSYKKYNIYT